MKLINLPALLPALLLGACSQLPGPTMKSHDLSGSHIYSSGPSLSSFVVQDRNNPRKICADRGADAAFEFSEAGDFSLSLVSVGKSDGEKSSAKENSGEEEMVGRTPAVLIARELLYRTCELSMNYSLTKEEAISLFKGTRDSIEKGWVSEAAKTTITIGDTLTNKNSFSVTQSDTTNTQDTTTTTGSASTTSSTSDASASTTGSASTTSSTSDASGGDSTTNDGQASETDQNQ